MKGRRRRWATMGLKGNGWRKKRRKKEREREREKLPREIDSATPAGAGEREPINRRALSQSRKTAKLHLPF